MSLTADFFHAFVVKWPVKMGIFPDVQRWLNCRHYHRKLLPLTCFIVSDLYPLGAALQNCNYNPSKWPLISIEKHRKVLYHPVFPFQAREGLDWLRCVYIWHSCTRAAQGGNLVWASADWLGEGRCNRPRQTLPSEGCLRSSGAHTLTLTYTARTHTWAIIGRGLSDKLVMVRWQMTHQDNQLLSLAYPCWLRVLEITRTRQPCVDESWLNKTRCFVHQHTPPQDMQNTVDTISPPTTASLLLLPFLRDLHLKCSRVPFTSLFLFWQTSRGTRNSQKRLKPCVKHEVLLARQGLLLS